MSSLELRVIGGPISGKAVDKLLINVDASRPAYLTVPAAILRERSLDLADFDQYRASIVDKKVTPRAALDPEASVTEQGFKPGDILLLHAKGAQLVLHPEEDDVPQPMIYVGSFLGKVVGIQHYSGLINRREIVIPTREPKNPYDSNAIAVRNTAGQMIGHFPRDVVAILAPILDKGELQVEARTGANVKNLYALTVEVSLYAPQKHHNRLAALFLSTLSGFNREPLPGGSSQKRMAIESFAKDMAAIFQNLGEKPGVSPQRPMADVFVGQLLPFQEYGLGWMRSREALRQISFEDFPGTKKRSRIENPSDSDESIRFFWRRSTEKDGSFLYTHTITNYTTKTVPNYPRGGIIADDMGLGKTVQLLALMSYPVDEGTDSMAGRTLIICPLSLLEHWRSHAATYLPSFKVCVYHGSSRDLSTAGANLVLITYGTLRSEGETSPIRKTLWDRIILDEAHNIKSAKSQSAQACVGLTAKVRWCVTGTPIQNRLDDLQSLFGVLHVDPFSDPTLWKVVIAKPLRAKDIDGVTRLRALMSMFCLRRTKDDKFEGKPLLTLPSITTIMQAVEFTPAERRVYDELKVMSSKSFFEKATVINGLVLLLRLRQLCDHASLLPSSTIDTTPDEDLRQVFLASNGDSCSICLEVLSNTVVTECRHTFCADCVEGLTNSEITTCPLCRQPLRIGFRSALSDGSEDFDVKSVTESSKISATLEIIRKRVASGEKVVVFSQWPPVLAILEKVLKSNGIASAKLIGSMSVHQREQQIASFKTNPEVRVMLLSTMAGGTGLNLTVASVVILVDPWWNPAIDKQAIMRVHRIGQTRRVTVFQMVMSDSVEMGVLELQRKKQALFDSTIGLKELAAFFQ